MHDDVENTPAVVMPLDEHELARESELLLALM
jgi:hypothetical protein